MCEGITMEGDIITAIAVGQPSGMLRPRYLPPWPSFICTCCNERPYDKAQPAAHSLALYLLAKRYYNNVPRPRLSRTWPLPLCKAKASPYWGTEGVGRSITCGPARPLPQRLRGFGLCS